MATVDASNSEQGIQVIGVKLLRCTAASSRRVQVVFAVDVPPGLAEPMVAVLARELTPEALATAVDAATRGAR